MRRMFNAGQYYERALRGELRMVVERSRPAPPQANQRPGTLSQTVAYWEYRTKVAIVHQYWHPGTGTVGGRGRPDPKMIFEGGVLYKLDPDLL